MSPPPRGLEPRAWYDEGVKVLCRHAKMCLGRSVLGLTLVLSGCGLMFVGDPVQEIKLDEQDDAQKNLEAIRRMVREPLHRTGPPGITPSLSQDSNAVVDSNPGVRDRSSGLGAASIPLVPSPGPSHPTTEAPAKLPWVPSPPARPSLPDRFVPAYTVPAPVGPDYSGPIRCMPDGMGGQRCRGG
ncbi:MAG TPA: hypothetical protein VFS39_13575 [Nitrospira sp.]|nr:hypothetical protein [Nitrospira sp.]